jgi:hypothetical protein
MGGRVACGSRCVNWQGHCERSKSKSKRAIVKDLDTSKFKNLQVMYANSLARALVP